MNLWIPYLVPDARAAAGRFRTQLGLSEVDSWQRPGETGVVLSAGRAFLEFVSPGETVPPPLGFEVESEAAVHAIHRGTPPADVTVAPHRYQRGHYGFEARGPAGTRLMVWSERE